MRHRLGGWLLAATCSIAVLGAVWVLAGTAGKVSSLTVPDVTTVSIPPGTTPATFPPGLAAVHEPAVAGVTTTTAPAIGPGNASLGGTVLGPNGPVGGATVELDRFVGDSMASLQVTAAADGSWNAAGILGGRYRVRAWQQPSLAMTDPQVTFLGDDQRTTITLQLTRFQGPQITAAVNPDPVQGQTETLAVLVSLPQVSSDGYVTATPEPSQMVTLVDGPAWQVANANPQTTGADGEALFYVVCTTAGFDPLSAQVTGQAPVTLQLPDCLPSESIPATTAPPDTSSVSSTTSTTTCPSGASTTTLFGGPVGETTTVPEGCPGD